MTYWFGAACKIGARCQFVHRNSHLSIYLLSAIHLGQVVWANNSPVNGLYKMIIGKIGLSVIVPKAN
jgi:hypothetical protein